MSDARFHVRRYIAKGWSVLPIPKGEKGPRIGDWQTRTFDVPDFDEDSNIGVHLGPKSGHLIDTDLDCPEALIAARELFLRTDLIHGRPSKPASHYWYIVENAKTEAFKDVDGSTLLEIRASGGQTVLPPSQHKSGELLSWEADGEPARYPLEVYRPIVVATACAVILGRHWPSQGGRHDAAGLAAGLLVALGMDDLLVKKVIEVAAIIARDDAIEDRARYAEDTVKRFKNGQKIGGGPKLADLLEHGDKVVDRIKSWFDVTAGFVDDLNDRHAVIFQQSGELIVITEDRDADGKFFLRFSPPQVIYQLYPEQVQVGATARGGPIMKTKGRAWFESARRRQYNGLELQPKGPGTPGYYNMWRGFSVEPKKGDWSKYRRHMFEVICSKNEELFAYVFAWMARAVQEPGQQAGTAIALRGGQGIGKGLFVRGVGELFGSHFVHLDSSRQLTGNFNAHLHNAIFVFADEASWPGDKSALGAFKRMITEPTLSIERKGMDIVTVKNMLHVMMASNEEWVVPASMDERRFVVIDVPNTHKDNYRYFGALRDELECGGSAALLYDLLEHEITVELRKIPKTKALFEQKRITATPQKRWWMSVLADGDLWRKPQYHARGESNPRGEWLISRDELYQAYIEAMHHASYGKSHAGLATELGVFLKKVLPEGYPRTIRTKDGRRHWLFPSLEVCRAKLLALYEMPDVEWETVEQELGDELF